MYFGSQNEWAESSGFRAWFSRHALIFPVIVIAGYSIGRGLGDSLQLLYVLGGLYTLEVMRFASHRGVIYIYLLLLFTFLMAVVYPEFAVESLKYWILYSLSGLVLLFTIGTFNQAFRPNEHRVMIWVPVALLVWFAAELGYFYFFAESFQPAIQVNGMILATLAPLVLFSPSNREPFFRLLVILFFGISFLLLLLADSRTEVLMLLAGGAIYLAFDRHKISILFVLIPLILVLAVLLDAVVFHEYDAVNMTDSYAWMDKVSSRRLTIWREALLHAPDNYLTGVGMSRSMEFLVQLGFVKHLHNLFIEIWYETGVLGLTAYLLLILFLLHGIPQSYRRLEREERRAYAVFLASGCAALIGAFLDKGYYHPLTRYYMLFCFTVLYLVHRRNTEGKT